MIEGFLIFVVVVLVVCYVGLIIATQDSDRYAAAQAKGSLVILTATLLIAGISALLSIYASPLLGKAFGFLGKLL